MLDLSKPIQTRDGRKVRILCTDARSNAGPVVGMIHCEHGDLVDYWFADGRYMPEESQHPRDLVNVPPPKKKVKVEVRLMKDVGGVVVAVAYSDEENACWNAGNPRYVASTTIEMEYEEPQP